MTDVQREVPHVLLVATVGGSTEPIVASIRHWNPDRIVFVVSPETRCRVEPILASAAAEGVSVPEGAYEVVEVDDSQDFAGCVRTLREFETDVVRWIDRSRDHRVLIDLTGGTKAMSAAQVLVARRWPCSFSYVGGTERTKGGVGVVVSGTEKLLHTVNPWNDLGYQAIEDACVAFDTGGYGIARELLTRARDMTSERRVKRELAAVLHLVEGYDLWDRFQHARAISCLERAGTGGNDLRSALGSIVGERVLSIIERHLDYLRQLTDSRRGRALLLDLIANARRRASEGRYDDAVARLYRATEAAAQLTLRDGHGIPDTGKVTFSSVPEPLAAAWRREGLAEPVALGVQRAYELLGALGDPLGARFRELDLHSIKSPLSARNNSILAHGFGPVSDDVYGVLFRAVLDLVGASDSDLPEFPRLAPGMRFEAGRPPSYQGDAAVEKQRSH